MNLRPGLFCPDLHVPTPVLRALYSQSQPSGVARFEVCPNPLSPPHIPPISSAPRAALTEFERGTEYGISRIRNSKMGALEPQFECPRPRGVLRSVLSRLRTVAVYFAIGSVFYGYFEGWSPLDTCYFLIVCAFATPFTPEALLSLTSSVRARAVCSWLGTGPAQRSGTATSFLRRPLESSSRVCTRWWA